MGRGGAGGEHGDGGSEVSTEAGPWRDQVAEGQQGQPLGLGVFIVQEVQGVSATAKEPLGEEEIPRLAYRAHGRPQSWAARDCRGGRQQNLVPGGQRAQTDTAT